MEIVPASGWEKLVKDIARSKGTVVLLGAADSGKSTLARHLLQKLLEKGISVCLVDADVGQSATGLPATISATAFRSLRDLTGCRPRSMFFIGTTNPAKSIGRMIYGTRKMAGACRRRRTEITVVDTTGLVSGRAGMALKLGKIRALAPENIVAIQKKGELEHIISVLQKEGRNVHILKPSGRARKTGRAIRTSYRQERFRDYFRRSETVRFSPTAGAGFFFYHGRPLDLFDLKEEVEPGCLVGLEKGENCLGLGIFEGTDKDGVLVRTPVHPGRKPDRISFGGIAVF